MTRGSGLVRRRAAAQRTLLAAAVCVVLPALVLVTLIRMHSAVSERDGVRHALGAIPEANRTVAVRQQADILLHLKGHEAGVDDAAALLDAAFQGIPHTTSRSYLTAQYNLAGRPSGAPESVYFASSEAVARNADLVQGAWPKAGGDGAFEVAVPQRAAADHGWKPGDTVAAASRLSDATASFRIVGVYQPKNPDSVYWQQDPLAGRQRTKEDQPVYGPLITDASVTAGYRLDLKRVDVTVTPDFGTVMPDDVSALARRLPALADPVSGIQIDAASQTVLLDDLAPRLTGIVADRDISARLILLPVIELGLLAFTALVLTTRLLAEHRRETDGLLRARGASVPGLFRIGLTEGLALAVPLALVSPVTARLLLERLADGGWTSITPTGIGLSADLWAVAVGGALLAAVMLGLAGLRSSGSFVEAKRVKSRSGARTAVQKAGLDVMVVALGVGAFWEIAQYGDGSSHSGSLGLPLVVSPSVLLLAGSLVSLRLLPFLVGAMEQVAARRRGVVGALAGWRVGRTARAYAAPMTLLIMAVAVGVQAVVFVTSSDRSATDQATHTVGTDVRIAGMPSGLLARSGTLAAVPGAGAGTAVLRTTTTFGQGDNAQDVAVLGLDPSRAADSVLLRTDLADRPWPQLTSALATDGWAANGDIPGVALPGRPATLSLDVRYQGSPQGKPGNRSELGKLRARATVVDAYGAGAQVELGEIAGADGGTHTLTAKLDTGAGKIAYPLRVTALSVTYLSPDCATFLNYTPTDDPRCDTDMAHNAPGNAERVTVAVDRLAADGAPVAMPAGTGAALLAEPADATDQHHLVSQCVGKSGTAFTAGGGGLFSVTESSGFCTDLQSAVVHTVQFAPQGKPTAVVPAIVSTDLLDKLRLRVGDTYQTTAFGVGTTTVKFVGAVRRMPGQQDQDKPVVIVPIGFLNALDAFTGGSSGTAEWWVRTAPGTEPSALAAAYRALDQPTMLSSAVTIDDRQTEANAIRHDPLRSGLRLTLVIAALAALLFILIGFALHSVIAVRERSTELALLNALGLARRKTAAMLLVEQAMLVLIGVAAGGLLAAVTIRSVLPLMILTDDGSPPVPQPRVVFDPAVLGTVGGLAVLFLLGTVGLVVSLRGREAAAQALRTGEER